MKLSRDFTAIINYFLDNICPPILRDCYYIMYPIYRLACGKSTAKLLKYKDHYAFLSKKEYSDYYEHAGRTPLAKRPTDLNSAGIHFIFDNIQGNECLDVGCGRGWLAKQLVQKGYKTTAVDIVEPIDYTIKDGYSFIKGDMENLPFSDTSFDTVISTHVLEHVPNFDIAFNELLRVTKKRLIIILPRQREYRYVADLHIRYFPYLYNVQIAFSKQKDVMITRVGSDWGVLINKD